MTKILVGLDEIATETQKVSGWCYFAVNEQNYIEFEKDVTELLSNTNKLTSFHGKKFKIEQANEYRDFLKIIRKHSELSNPSLVCCTLNNPTWNQQYIDFCDRLFTNVLTNVGVSNPKLIDITKHFVGPLFVLQRMTSSFESPASIQLEVDSDDIKEKFAGSTTQIQGFDFGSDFLLEQFYNIYRKYQFPNSPELIKNGISVLKDEKSFLIQAADVIGNFSAAYIYYKLENTSKSRIEKGKIFEEVFGDKFGAVDFSSDIELFGQNDLNLKFEGAFTLKFGVYE